MNKIRKGDDVIVLTGRDKGKRGKYRCVKTTLMWLLRVSIQSRSTSSLTR
jgi:ribosomal protein L24